MEGDRITPANTAIAGRCLGRSVHARLERIDLIVKSDRPKPARHALDLLRDQDPEERILRKPALGRELFARPPRSDRKRLTEPVCDGLFVKGLGAGENIPQRARFERRTAAEKDDAGDDECDREAVR